MGSGGAMIQPAGPDSVGKKLGGVPCGTPRPYGWDRWNQVGFGMAPGTMRLRGGTANRTAAELDQLLVAEAELQLDAGPQAARELAPLLEPGPERLGRHLRVGDRGVLVRAERP